jgi:DNA-binding NarL/FixJ family response regulator
MLLGTAAVRLGEYGEGFWRLNEARTRAANAHPTIRSEIALSLALAYYGQRDLDGADRELDAVSADSDIIYARALEYRGWVATARNDYAASATAFKAAIEHLDQCRHRDRYLEANALRALSHLAYEQLDRDLTDWFSRRVRAFNWTADGLIEPYFWVTLNESFNAEIDARIDDALEAASEAERVAPSPALALEAACRRANVLAHEGEGYGLRNLARTIARRFYELNHDALIGDERSVALAVAEVLAQANDAIGARRVLAIYNDGQEMSAMHSMARDSRPAAYAAFVAAQAVDASNDYLQATKLYRVAFSQFRGIGYHYRALQIGIRLAEITGQQYLYGYATEVSRPLNKQCWIRRRLASRPAAVFDVEGNSLTDNQIAIVRLVCAGRTNKEIANELGRSPHTIKHILNREIFPRLGVKSRSALTSEAIKRGIFAGRRASDHTPMRRAPLVAS